MPGSSDYRKKVVLATSPLDDRLGVASHKIVVKCQEGDSSTTQHIQQTVIFIIHRVQKGHQWAKAMTGWIFAISPT